MSTKKLLIIVLLIVLSILLYRQLTTKWYFYREEPKKWIELDPKDKFVRNFKYLLGFKTMEYTYKGKSYMLDMKNMIKYMKGVPHLKYSRKVKRG